MTNAQCPMTKEAPMTNDEWGIAREVALAATHWSLGFGHSLVIGIWDLVIHQGG
jgi:hypothetical protein